MVKIKRGLTTSSDLLTIRNNTMTLIPTKESFEQKKLMDELLRLEKSNKELAEMLEEFTNAVETEEIIIKENYDNDGWENCGNRLYEKAKSLITKHKQS